MRAVIAVLLLFCISSCSFIGNAELQKRKYRNGYYFHLRERETATAINRENEALNFSRPDGRNDTVLNRADSSAYPSKFSNYPPSQFHSQLPAKFSPAKKSFQKFHKSFVRKVSRKKFRSEKRDGALSEALGQLFAQILFWLLMIVLGVVVLAVFYFFCSAFALLFGVTLIAGASFLLYGIPLSVGICAYLMTTALLCFVAYFVTRRMQVPTENLLLLFLGIALLVPMFLLYINGFQLLFGLMFLLTSAVFAKAIDGI